MVFFLALLTITYLVTTLPIANNLAWLDAADNPKKAKASRSIRLAVVERKPRAWEMRGLNKTKTTTEGKKMVQEGKSWELGLIITSGPYTYLLLREGGDLRFMDSGTDAECEAAEVLFRRAFRAWDSAKALSGRRIAAAGVLQVGKRARDGSGREQPARNAT